MLPKIAIQDSNFDHLSYKRLGSFFRWDWGAEGSPMVFTEKHLNEALSSNQEFKVVWLVEPPIVIPGEYEFVKRNIDKFDLVFSLDYEFAHKYDNVVFYPLGGSWVFPEDQVIHKKSKLLSMITSLKKDTYGQRLRLAVKDTYGPKINLYGREFNPIDNKGDGLRDHCFSFAIENSKLKYYFTEKLIDCFITGTVPIYWGCPEIEKFFNPEGMIFFNTVEEAGSIIESLSMEKYEKMFEAVKDNYQRALSYCRIEDNLWRAGLKNVIGDKA